jgi:hypothetical protein
VRGVIPTGECNPEGIPLLRIPSTAWSWNSDNDPDTIPSITRFGDSDLTLEAFFMNCWWEGSMLYFIQTKYFQKYILLV